MSFLAAFHHSLSSVQHLPWRQGCSSCFDDKLSPALKQRLADNQAPDRPKIDVIFQVNPDFFGEAERIRRRFPVKKGAQVRPLRLIASYSATLLAPQVQALVQSPQIEYLTLDAVTRVAAPDLAGSNSWLTSRQPAVQPVVQFPSQRSRSVGAALFDSGVPSGEEFPQGSIRLSLDFTKSSPSKVGAVEAETNHGLQIAGVIASSTARSQGQSGDGWPRRRVEFVALRVVDNDGRGMTSDLIRAIDWVVENRREFHVHLANLSLDHPILEPHLKDPLCQAVRRLVESGVVTVVSAGRADLREGQKAFGSPAVEPSVITVAAVASKTTTKTADRLSAKTERNGGIFKPDLIVESDHPDSGSFVAAKVARTVAGMLSANTALTPKLVKSILLTTACPVILDQAGPASRVLYRLDEEKAVRAAARLELRKHQQQLGQLRKDRIIWA